MKIKIRCMKKHVFKRIITLNFEKSDGISFHPWEKFSWFNRVSHLSREGHLLTCENQLLIFFQINGNIYWPSQEVTKLNIFAPRKWNILWRSLDKHWKIPNNLMLSCHIKRSNSNFCYTRTKINLILIFHLFLFISAKMRKGNECFLVDHVVRNIEFQWKESEKLKISEMLL